MRLIDADELIKDRVENDPVVIAVKCAKTAFDKEKVIEELKEIMRSVQFAQSLIGTDLVQCGGFSYGYYNGVKDVIKIVEKGGI